MNNLKVLINNVVPLNNGDIALFSSLYKELVNAGFSVKIATYNYEIAKLKYPHFPFVREIGDYKIFTKLPLLKVIVLPVLFFFSKTYKESDIIIGSPGGYINSNYNIKNSLSVYKIAKKKGKKTSIYAQSVGPLNEMDSVFFKNIMNYIDFIYVRDKFSYTTISNLNIEKDKFKLTKDAAFLMKNNSFDYQKKKVIAVSVREWSFDNRDINKYKNLMKELVIILINRGYYVDFLSTCQGLSNYKNDAIIAHEIYDDLDLNSQKKINVLAGFYSFHSYYRKLEDYHFILGTRLHMCIIAMTKRIPAFNISYEIKGKECYNYLELSDYSIDYNQEVEKSKEMLHNFIDNIESIKVKLEVIIPKIRSEVKRDFSFFIDKIT